MTDTNLLQLFARLNVLKEGHFRLTSGRHSGKYMQCAALFEHPREAERVVAELVPKLPETVDAVAAPAIGGILMGYETARALGVRSVFAEREGGRMTLRRGFSVQPNDRILLVEDVVTTGGSVREVMDLLTGAGAVVEAVAAIVDRSGGTAEFGVPFIPLLTVDIETFSPEECPLCRAGQPITKPGSRN